MQPPFFVDTPLGRVPSSVLAGAAAAGKETRGRRNLAAGKAGLVHASNLNRPRISLCKNGSLVEVKLPPRPQERKPGVRGKIVEFSRAARWAMRKFLASLDRGVLPCFPTLTYPGVFYHDPAGWKADLNR